MPRFSLVSTSLSPPWGRGLSVRTEERRTFQQRPGTHQGLVDDVQPPTLSGTKVASPYSLTLRCVAICNVIVPPNLSGPLK